MQDQKMSGRQAPQPQAKQQTFNPPQEQQMQTAVKGGQQPGGPVPPGLRAPYFSPAPPQQQQQQQQQQQPQQQNVGGAQGYYPPAAVPEFRVAGVGGAPYTDPQGSHHRTNFSMAQLRQTDGIIPLQYGTNRYASQRGMTGFGSPRDVNGKHLHRIWDDFYTDEPQFDEQQQQQQQYQ